MNVKRLLGTILSLALLGSMLPAAVGAETKLMPYVSECAHREVRHVPQAQPSCTEQGTREYWYCPDCRQYFQDAQLQTPVMPGQLEGWVSERSFLLPALGHSFTGDLCDHCGLQRPSYMPVTALGDFDALPQDTSYILVIRDGEKTYAAYLPTYENPCDVDTDGDGLVDALELDQNGNQVPDGIEMLFADWYNGDMDGDGDIDVEDYDRFVADFVGTEVSGMEAYALFLEYNYYDLYLLYEELAYDVPNFVEVAMAADGSITLQDEGALEFWMMSAGVVGGQPIEQGEPSQNGILETERIRAAWIPNYWIAGDGLLGYHCEGHFMTQNRQYGDRERPGFMDVKNWKLSFNTDGSVCMVSTWGDYDDTGALRFVKYRDPEGNTAMTIVGMPQSLWADSQIMQNQIQSLPVYLYAAAPVYGHAHSWDGGEQTQAPTCTENGVLTYTCEICGQTRSVAIDALGHAWGEWTYATENTHTRSCLRGCGVEPETGAHEWGAWEQADEEGHHTFCDFCHTKHWEGHTWDEGVVTKEPSETEAGVLQYTCTVCGATKTEQIPAKTMPGDVNNDGRVNARDARALLRFLAGLADPGEVVEAAADFNDDGRINARDAREILRHIAGLEPSV